MVTKAELNRMAKKVEASRNKRAAFFSMFSLASGFGSGAYFVLAATPSFTVGLILLALFSFFMVVAIIDYFQRTSVKIGLIVVVVIASGFAYAWAKAEWTNKIENDVKTNLLIRMDVPSSGDAWDSLISLTNNSSSVIGKRRITCHLNQLNWGGHGRMINSSGLWDFEERLRTGGDRQTQGCLINSRGVPLVSVDMPLECADVSVIVDFSVDSSPVISAKKELRFVFGFVRDKSWVQQPVEHRGSYCPI
jgi:hypothetical protein